VSIAADIAADFAAMRADVPATLTNADGDEFEVAATNKRVGRDYDPLIGGYGEYDRTVRVAQDDLTAADWTPEVGDLVTVDGASRRIIATSAGPWGGWLALDLGSPEA